MVSRIFRDTESAELNRRRQINTLKVFNDNVTEIQEDVEYKVEFNSGGNNMTLLVILGPEFPMNRPVLKILPEVVHPWVNESSEVVTAPGLINYTAHSDLGRVVQAIIREFERRPPPLSTDVTSIASSNQQNEVTADGRVSPVYLHSYQNPPTCQAQIMPQYSRYSNAPVSTHLCPRAGQFPELDNLSLEELKKLDESEDRQDEFLLKYHPDSQKTDMALEDLLTQNEELAKDNVSQQPKLEQLKTVVRKKLDTVVALKAKYESRSNEYQKWSEKYSPESIRDLLQAAAIHSDEESEKVAEQFLNKQLDVDEFVNSYIEKRTLFYCRKTKEEKLSRQLQELERAGY